MQRPHPPICIGGIGERRTLRSVARFAQHWNHPGGSPEDVVHKLEVLRGHCADIGREPVGDPRVHAPAGRAGRRPVAPRRAAAEYEAAGVQLGIVYLPVPHTPAILEPLAEALSPVAT